MTDERSPVRTDGRWLADDMVDPDVYATGVDDGWNDVELYRLIVRQLQRSFHSGTEADRQTMLASRPHLTGTKWDAAMAAVIEHTARVHGYDPPTWVDEPERFLDEPVKLTRPETDSDSAWQAGAFLRHGVNVDSRDLDWRTGDGRHWTAELQEHRGTHRESGQGASRGGRESGDLPRRRRAHALRLAHGQAHERPRHRHADRSDRADGDGDAD